METNAIEFLTLVSRMREYQKLYFQTKNTATLKTCKDLEKQVDEMIRKAKSEIAETMKETHPKAAEGNLFY